MRCHLFIDEVGNGDLKGSAQIDNERYLSLTGLITRLDFYDTKFKPDMLNFKIGIWGETKGPQIVLHRREIMRKEDDFAILRDDELLGKFNAGLLHLFSSLPYLAHTVVIDKRDHLDTYGTWRFDPYHYCLHVLIERYVLWLKRNDYVGDVSAEPRTAKQDRRLKESYANLYARGSDHIAGDVMRKYLTSKEIKFVPKSANCPAMQICDLLAYPSFKSMKREKLNQPQPDDFGNKIVDILSHRKYARHPKTREIWGVGKKWLPK